MTDLRKLGPIAPLGLLIALVLGSCGSTDLPDVELPDVTLPDVTLPDVTVPDVTLPDVTLPDVTLPDVTVPEPDGPDDSSPDPSSGGDDAVDQPADDGYDVGLVLAMVVMVGVALAWVASVVAGSRRHQEAASREHAALRSQIDDVIASARWADSQAMILLGSPDPAAFAPVLASLQNHLVESEVRAARVSGEVDNAGLSAALASVGERMAALRGSALALIRVAEQEGAAEAQKSERLVALRNAVEQSRADLAVAAQQLMQLRGH